jgi:hypothetical protein
VSGKVEIELEAPDGHPLGVWIEPWGDRVEIAAGARARLYFDGDVRESVVVRWMEDAFWVGVPRYSTLRVKTDGGDVIREYDTRDIPPVPEGFRPI